MLGPGCGGRLQVSNLPQFERRVEKKHKNKKKDILLSETTVNKISRTYFISQLGEIKYDEITLYTYILVTRERTECILTIMAETTVQTLLKYTGHIFPSTKVVPKKSRIYIFSRSSGSTAPHVCVILI